jgi:hypothetical protein
MVMPTRLAKLRALSGGEWRLLLSATLLLPLAELGLRLFGFQRCRRWIGQRIPEGAAAVAEPDLAWATTAARMVAIAARHGPYRASCLRQALVLWFLLGRRGIPARLRIGAARGKDGFNAHAWIELGERVLIGGDERVRERYATLL